jgi:hypothetical protein
MQQMQAQQHMLLQNQAANVANAAPAALGAAHAPQVQAPAQQEPAAPAIQSQAQAHLVESTLGFVNHVFSGQNQQSLIAALLNQIQLLNDQAFAVVSKGPQPATSLELAVDFLANPLVDPWTLIPMYLRAVDKISVSQLNAALSSNNSLLAINALKRARNSSVRAAHGVPEDATPGTSLSVAGWVFALANLCMLIETCITRIKGAGNPLNAELTRLVDEGHEYVRQIGHLSLIAQRLSFTAMSALKLQKGLAQTWSTHSQAITLARQAGAPPPMPVFDPEAAHHGLALSIANALRDEDAPPGVVRNPFLNTESMPLASTSRGAGHNGGDNRRPSALAESRAGANNTRRARPDRKVPQFDSLKAVARLPLREKESYEFLLCPSFLDPHTQCPADSADSCANYHVCYHCFKRGKPLSQCLDHKPIECTNKVLGKRDRGNASR